MKKLFALLVMAVVAVQSWAAVGDTFEVGNLKYEITTEATSSQAGLVNVIGLSDAGKAKSSLALDITYPVTYNGTVYHTYAIGQSAFMNNGTITSVRIRYGIKSVHKTAFGNCKVMKTLYIPSSVRNIAEKAFWYNNALTTVYWASNGDDLFMGTELFNTGTPYLYTTPGYGEHMRLTVGKYFTHNAESPEAYDYFYPSTGAYYVVLWEDYDGVRGCAITGYKVGSTGGVFKPVGSFTLANYGGSFRTTQISRSAFYMNYDLKEADFSGLYFLNTVDYRAFEKCINLTKVTIPQGAIKAEAFSGCSALTSVTLNEGVTELESDVFKGCSSLTNLSIPASVTKIDDYAFDDALAMKNITVASANENYASYDGALYTKDFSHIMVCPSAKTSITLHPNTQTMSDIGRSFYKSSLTSLTFPYGMKEIYHMYCSKIKKIVVPSSIEHIGYNAFGDCVSLEEFYINKKDPIKYNSFFAYPASVKVYVHKDKATEYRNEGWSVANVSTEKIAYDHMTGVSYGDIYYTVTSTEACNVASSDFDGRTMLVGYDVKSASCVLPNFVSINNRKYATTMIASDSFRSSIDFTVTGAACVDTIASGAFSLARGITSINLSNVYYISREAFLNCTKLATCKWGNRLHFIGNNAFSGTALTEVTIPESCTTLGMNAFSNNIALTDLIILGDKMKTFKAAFLGNNADVTKITVKSDLLYDYYQAMANWNVSANKTAQQRLAPYIIPEHDTQMFSACTQLNAPTGVKLNYVTALDAATGVATTATRGYVFAGYGYLLTGLTPGEMYKFLPNNTSNARMPNNMLRDVATTPLDMGTIANTYVWNAVDKVFEKPAAGTTLPSSSAYLQANDHTAAKYYTDLYPAPTPDYKTGDANGDGKIDVADINCIINVILENEAASVYEGRADVNGDGKVDVADINSVIDLILAM